MEPKQLHEQFLRQRAKNLRKIRFYQISLFLVLIVSWELASFFRLIDPLIFSSPLTVLQLIVQKISDMTLFSHVWITFVETILGFILGTLLGTLLAIFLWSTQTAAKVLDPFLVVLNAMPKVAIGPIILVIFGPNILAVIMMGTLISVIISTIVIFSAFQQVDANYIKVLQVFQANRRQMFTHAIFPASLPIIISTLKVNVGLSWVGVIVGEFLVSSQGLGYLIISGFQIFNFHLVFLSLVVIAVLATFMYKAVELLEQILLKRFHF